MKFRNIKDADVNVFRPLNPAEADAVRQYQGFVRLEAEIDQTTCQVFVDEDEAAIVIRGRCTAKLNRRKFEGMIFYSGRITFNIMAEKDAFPDPVEAEPALAE